VLALSRSLPAADDRAAVTDHTSTQDALWFALGANRENGQRMTSADKKHAILMALTTWGDGGKTQAQIAAQIGVAESTLSYHAVQLSNLGQLKRPDRVLGKDGKSYPAARRRDRRRPALRPCRVLPIGRTASAQPLAAGRERDPGTALQPAEEVSSASWCDEGKRPSK
jgi:hypothetical protein